MYPHRLQFRIDRVSFLGPYKNERTNEREKTKKKINEGEKKKTKQNKKRKQHKNHIKKKRVKRNERRRRGIDRNEWANEGEKTAAQPREKPSAVILKSKTRFKEFSREIYQEKNMAFLLPTRRLTLPFLRLILFLHLAILFFFFFFFFFRRPEFPLAPILILSSERRSIFDTN